MSEPAIIAAGLSVTQRRAVLANERLMGGYYGLAWHDPPLAEPVGVCHPIFGSHYQLNELGLAVRDALKDSRP